MRKFPKIMGILNVTPDSFSDGGKFYMPEIAVEHGLQLLKDGADVLDIGGESTRPGAEKVSEVQEIKRVLPVIRGIKEKVPDALISIDTTKYNIAFEAVKAGAGMINDISGLRNDERLAGLAADKELPLVIMHMQGTPGNMQKNPSYNDVITEIFSFLKEKIEFARETGVKEIYADVGIGFGKTYEHNIELLKNIDEFSRLDAGLLLGISRKSFIGMMLGIEKPEARDFATTLIHSILLNSAIDIIRVHNVKLLTQLKVIYQVIMGSKRI